MPIGSIGNGSLPEWRQAKHCRVGHKRQPSGEIVKLKDILKKRQVEHETLLNLAPFGYKIIRRIPIFAPPPHPLTPWQVQSKSLIKVRRMHVPEAQRPFLDSVQEALRRYDEQLKDINHKVESNDGKIRICPQLRCVRFGRILSWPMKNTRLMITSASSSIVFNQVAIKSALRPMACRRPWKLSTLTEVADVLLSSTLSMVRTLNKSPTT